MLTAESTTIKETATTIMDKRRMCPNCRAFITTDDKVCPYCEVQVGPRAIDRRSPADVLGGLIPHARFTTMLILLLNTGLYLAMVLQTSRTGSGMAMDFDEIGRAHV